MGMTREEGRIRTKRPLHRVAERRIRRARPFLCVIFAIAVGESIGESTDDRTPCRHSALWELRRRDRIACDGTRYAAAFLQPTFPVPGIDGERENICDALRRRVPAVDGARRAPSSHGAQIDDGNDDGDGGASNDDDRLRARRGEEWIDGRLMMQILAREKAEERRREEMEDFDPRLRRRSIRNSDERTRQSSSSASDAERSDFVSRISYTDADTLRIEIPPSGVDANAFATGAFSALWFSAVVPATISMLSAGLIPSLFMAPFWLAGGAVAKTAVYDPFVSSSLSIGKYLWTLEKKYLKSVGGLNTKREEGSTESLDGASVELAMVVNNVGRYQLRLLFDGNGSATFGKGLAQEELEYISQVVNDHCAMLKEST